MVEKSVVIDKVTKKFILPHQKSKSVKSVFVNIFNKNNTKEIQTALKDINFKVNQGEFYGVLGRNGSGKSTLLKIIAGIYNPTNGSVKIKGKLVPFIELGVGFNPELTGRENVFLNGAMLGFSNEEMALRYDKIVEFAELEQFMDQKLKNYSSGMQVRLAFSVAIQAEADILLIDEVLAVGDAEFQRKCFEYFKSLKKNKKTVIFVTHDMTAVREFCDKALLIEKSEIVEIGTADKIASLYEKLFIKQVQEEEKEQVHEPGERWGDKRAEIVLAETNKQTYTNKDDDIKISTKIKLPTTDEPLVVGVAVKSPDGTAVCGTNTQELGQKISGSNKVEASLEWNFPNIFSDGKYTVDIAIHGLDGHSVADWWSDAIAFKVKRPIRSPYNISPNIKITQK